MVGSSLAVVAAGSLLAFSTLAEQAGLEGLATRGIEPAQPGRVRSGEHAITIPAPATAPPTDLRVEVSDFGREGSRARVRTVAPVEPPAPAPLPPREPVEPEVRRVNQRARVAVDGPDVDDKVEKWNGPPYGHAYGHHKNKHGKSPKRERKNESPEAPVYARTANDEAPPKKSKAPKLQKVKKVKKAKGAAHPGKGKAKGHSKHAAGPVAAHSNGKAKGHSNGKAKGHAKHAHKGKGKGHSKHGG